MPEEPSRDTFSFYFNICQAVAIAILHVGAAILFLQGLKDFTRQTKVAYSIFCFGLACYGLAQLQLPILIVLDAFDSFWVRSGLIVLPYLVPVTALFIGMKTFAKLFKVKTVFASFWIVFLVAVVAAVVSTFLPHAHVATTEQEFDAMVGLNVWGGFFILAAAITTLKVKRAAGATYSSFLAWMFIAFVLVILQSWSYLVPLLVSGEESWMLTSGATLTPYVLVGICWVRAAYAFNTLGAQEEAIARATAFTFFGKPKILKQNTHTSALDIITYAAQLASNQDAIDNSLDKLREVTASLEPGQKPTLEQVKILRGAYLEIERYLTTEEPVRRFTQDALRKNIKEKLSLADLSPLNIEPARQAPPTPSAAPVYTHR